MKLRSMLDREKRIYIFLDIQLCNPLKQNSNDKKKKKRHEEMVNSSKRTHWLSKPMSSPSWKHGNFKNPKVSWKKKKKSK